MKVYFDLDRVLADFDRGVLEFCGFQPRDQEDRTPGYDDVLWAGIRNINHFYDRLELMPGAKEMFDYVYDLLGDDCQILSGIPKPQRGIVTAGKDKISWTHRLLNPNVKVNIVYREEKIRFCTGSDCILVDDFGANVRAWKEHGGTGILHLDSMTSFKQLKTILQSKYYDDSSEDDRCKPDWLKEAEEREERENLKRIKEYEKELREQDRDEQEWYDYVHFD